MILFTKQLKGKLKGIFSAPYEVRIPDGDSSPYFGNYLGQRYGRFDTSTCWAFAMCNIAETQLELEWKLGRFSEEQKKWFKDNGYIDEDGDFYLSRRWAAILSGVRDNGNEQRKGWEIAMAAGFIPHKMLPYSEADAYDEANQGEFNDEYFNKDVITKEMEKMGIEFLKRVNISAEPFGRLWENKSPDEIEKALKQGSLQIGIPIPWVGWNSKVNHDWDGQQLASHSVELYKYDRNDPYPYYIYDSYEPHLKRLSKNYYIPIATRAILTARREKVPVHILIWLAMWEWYFITFHKESILNA